MPRINHDELTLMDRVIHINRVAKVVKGGRRFSFSAVVSVGDGMGHVGIGFGKAKEAPEAIRKAIEKAKKQLIKVPLHKGTIPHEILGRFGAGKVFLKPAAPGTGVIAGGPVRAIMESAGVKNVLSKSLGTSNPQNVVKATMDGLSRLKTLKDVAALREKDIDEIIPGIRASQTD